LAPSPFGQLPHMKEFGQVPRSKKFHIITFARWPLKSPDLSPPGNFFHFQPRIPKDDSCFGPPQIELWRLLLVFPNPAFSGVIAESFYLRHDSRMHTPPRARQTVECVLQKARRTKLMSHSVVVCIALPQSRSKTVKLLLQHPVEAVVFLGRSMPNGRVAGRASAQKTSFTPAAIP
jgi:hypothetical protein